VELKVLGGNPRFGMAGNYEGLPQIIDITGGKKYIFEWNNAQNYTIQIGIEFYGSTFEIRPEMIVIFVLNGLTWVATASVIIIWIVRRKKKRAEEDLRT